MRLKHPLYYYRRYLLFLGLAVFAFLNLYKEFRTDFSHIPQILGRANLLLASLIIVLQIAAYTVNAFVSGLLFRILNIHVKFIDNIKVSVTNELGNHVLPILGGSITTYYGYSRLRIERHAIILVSLTWLLLLGGNAVLFLAISLAIIPKKQATLLPVREIGWIIAMLTIFIIILYFVLQRNHQLRTRIHAFFHEKMLITPDRLREALALLAQKPSFGISAIVLSAFYFLSDTAMLVVAFNTVGQPVHVSLVVYGFVLSSVLSILTLMPSSPGVMEASLYVVFSRLGVAGDIALFATVLYRILSYWIWVPASAWFLAVLRKKSDAYTPGRDGENTQ